MDQKSCVELCSHGVESSTYILKNTDDIMLCYVTGYPVIGLEPVNIHRMNGYQINPDLFMPKF